MSRGAVMETALCNDATHGSIIIETIMGLDSNTGVLWVGGWLGMCEAPWFIYQLRDVQLSLNS